MGHCLSSPNHQHSDGTPTAPAAQLPPQASPRMSAMRPVPLHGGSDLLLDALDDSSSRLPALVRNRGSQSHAAPLGTSPGSSSSSPSRRAPGGGGASLRGASFRSTLDQPPATLPTPIESPRLRTSTTSRTAVAAVQFADVVLRSVSSMHHPTTTTSALDDAPLQGGHDDDAFLPATAAVTSFPPGHNGSGQQSAQNPMDAASCGAATPTTTGAMDKKPAGASNTEWDNSLLVLGASGLLLGGGVGDASSAWEPPGASNMHNTTTLMSSFTAENNTTQWQQEPLLSNGKHKDQLARPHDPTR